MTTLPEPYDAYCARMADEYAAENGWTDRDLDDDPEPIASKGITMNKHCAWCGRTLFGREMRGDVCHRCLNGETLCDGCGRPLTEHIGGEGCPPYAPYDSSPPPPAARVVAVWVA